MKMAKIGLIGNPNCGKTTLFNALTGAKQQVGNWPGVTVERKSGFFNCQDWEFELIDLPGTYSLSIADTVTSLDERIAVSTILGGELDVIINILDATNLERNLFLTTQLLEMGVPVIITLNMMDSVKKSGVTIDVEKLSQQLGCPVLPISATRKSGLKLLKQVLMDLRQQPKSIDTLIHYPAEIETAISKLVKQIDAKHHARVLALRALENDSFSDNCLTKPVLDLARQFQQDIEIQCREEADILIADARYCFIGEVAKVAIAKPQNKENPTHAIDKVVLNRYLGIPIFLFVMYLMFIFAINIGGAFQDLFDIGSDTIFVQGLAHIMQQLGSPTWLTAIIAAGFGKGINTVITFTPIIGGMFLFLSFLESSGYMARAAFVMDRFMRAIGLPGKSFVPMIVGFGCNVPAIMASRTLENRHDRVLTILMSPFMSCGARLAIFAVFTAAFFPRGGQNVVFALYFTGVVVAILTGLVLRKTLLKGKPSPLVMELPPYRLPTIRAMLLQTWQRLKGFLFKAGKLIIPICVLIGALNTININGTLNTDGGSEHSVLSVVGKTVTPVFQPLGIQQDNWPATVGLLTGVLAKEVVIATLNTLYTQAGSLQVNHQTTFNFLAGIKAALDSVPQNLRSLKDSFKNPVMAYGLPHEMSKGMFGVMYSRFDGQLGAFAYLLFVLLYFPCVSAAAVMVRELNRRWTIFSLVWATGLAYGVAVLFFQAATIIRHPISSLSWIVGIILAFFATIFSLKRYSDLEHLQKPLGGDSHVSI